MNSRVIAILIFCLTLPCVSIAQLSPQWLEVDSLSAINYRLRSDFSLSMNDATKQIKQLYSYVDTTHVRNYIDNHYLETLIIDGVEYMHRKSPRNFSLLCPDIRGEWEGRGAEASKEEVMLVDSLVAISNGDGSCFSARRVKFRFSIDVPRHDFLIGDTLKVWMPLPIESARQKDVRIISSYPDEFTTSENSKSLHNTIFFSQPVTEQSDSIMHFEYVGEYTVSAQYYSPDYIRENMTPYDTTTTLYKKYTSIELPHITYNKLAYGIVGGENCPYRQSEMVYDYINKHFPWAGAREYSTIPCIPQYVLDEKHGDCGQVALLYISLMRTLGIPARWESGWMLHPGSQNLHDWAEVYFEGIGWVPVDVSFGRYISSDNLLVQNYYSTGMDAYRFATNTGICSPLYPEKKYLRSETVDFQVGEVECSKGNLFYPGWKKKLEIIETIIIK